MGIKRSLLSIGAAMVTAVTTVTAAESSAFTDDTKDFTKISEKSAFYKKSSEQESKSLVAEIERGRKVTHGPVSFDMPKLKKLQRKNEILRNFNIVFEGDNVGLTFYDDGKRGWFNSNEEPKTYMVTMSRENFENFLAAMLKKEKNEEESDERSGNPETWTFKDPYPHFYIIDKNGNRGSMKEEKDAKSMYDKLIETICEMNNQGVIDIAGIVKGYKKEIQSAGGPVADALLAVITSGKTIQNGAIKVASSHFQDEFKDLALSSDWKRKLELDAFSKEKQKAIALQESKRKALEQAEQERKRSLVAIDKMEEIELTPNYKEYDGSQNSRIYFYCNGKVIDIWSINGVANGYISGAGVNRRMEPEEWMQVASLLDRNLNSEQKAALGEHFFNAINKKINKDNLSIAAIATSLKNQKI